MPTLQRDPAFKGGGEPQAVVAEAVANKTKDLFAPA